MDVKILEVVFTLILLDVDIVPSLFIKIMLLFMLSTALPFQG